MSSVEVKRIGVTKLDVDAVVNAANEGLWEGGGVCGAIFKEAGSAELTKACNAIGGCKTGGAAITPGFNLKAKYIIHAVGPRWTDGKHGEPSLLYDAYKESLNLAKENGCHSIGFPLISAGIFGYPKEAAWRKAIQACDTFIKKNPDYDIKIIFAVLDDNMVDMGNKAIADILEDSEEKIPEVKGEPLSEELDKKTEAFCRKYEVLLIALHEDDDLREWCAGYSAYTKPDKFIQLGKIIWQDFFKQAYDDGIVISNYSTIISNSGLNQEDVSKPSKEWVRGLSKQEIIACIAFHFRMDHINKIRHNILFPTNIFHFHFPNNIVNCISTILNCGQIFFRIFYKLPCCINLMYY